MNTILSSFRKLKVNRWPSSNENVIFSVSGTYFLLMVLAATMLGFVGASTFMLYKNYGWWTLPVVIFALAVIIRFIELIRVGWNSAKQGQTYGIIKEVSRLLRPIILGIAIPLFSLPLIPFQVFKDIVVIMVYMVIVLTVEEASKLIYLLLHSIDLVASNAKMQHLDNELAFVISPEESNVSSLKRLVSHAIPR